MSRVIRINDTAKERTQLIQSIILALQELMRQSEVTTRTRDLAAFISLALEAISASIDSSVAAWEKRGYWLKADRFRLEWEWADRLGAKMRQALLMDDWDSVAITAAQIADRLKSTQMPKRRQDSEPWLGAWEILSSSRQPKR